MVKVFVGDTCIGEKDAELPYITTVWAVRHGYRYEGSRVESIHASFLGAWLAARVIRGAISECQKRMTATFFPITNILTWDGGQEYVQIIPYVLQP